MALDVVTTTREHLFNSTVAFFLSIINEATGAPVTGASPDIHILRDSDGFFFNGTVFVDTSGVPTALGMSEVGSTPAPGLYFFSFVDPGPVTGGGPQLLKDLYQLRFLNTGAPPTGGTLWDIKEFARELRDINTSGR